MLLVNGPQRVSQDATLPLRRFAGQCWHLLLCPWWPCRPTAVECRHTYALSGVAKRYRKRRLQSLEVQLCMMNCLTTCTLCVRHASPSSHRRWLRQHGSAVRIKHLPVRKRAARPDKVQDRGRHVAVFAGPSRRQALTHTVDVRLVVLVGLARAHLRWEDAGRDRVHANLRCTISTDTTMR
jgi:hypothetical protein